MFKMIGFVGHPKSGKSTLAKYLKEKYKFSIVSGSKILKKSALEDYGINLKNRKEFDNFHKNWRKKMGLNAMSKIVVDTYVKNKTNICFENIRNINDAMYFLKHGGVIINLKCDINTRYKRNEDNNLSFYDFSLLEKAEYDSQDVYGSHIEKIEEISNYIIITKKDIVHSRLELDLILEKLKSN